MMIRPELAHWLILAIALFSIGLFGFLTQKSAIRMIMSLELMLNSVVLSLVALNSFQATERLDGKIFALFVIAAAAAEVVLALALFVAIYKQQGTLDVTEMRELKE